MQVAVIQAVPSEVLGQQENTSWDGIGSEGNKPGFLCGWWTDLRERPILGPEGSGDDGRHVKQGRAWEKMGEDKWGGLNIIGGQIGESVYN